MSPSRLRKLLRTLVRQHKDKKCADCGKRYPPEIMSYDHLRDKRFNLGGSLRGYTKEDVLYEISKCQVVCLECHREREIKRATYNNHALSVA